MESLPIGGTNLWISLLFLLFLLVSAFFTSSEIAFLSLQRLRTKHLESIGVHGTDRVIRMMERPEKLVATTVLGNNLAQNAAVALATVVALTLMGEEQAVAVATLATTVLLVLFGEMIPKSFAARHGERLALLYVRPMEMIEGLFSPITTSLTWLTSRLTGTKAQALVSEGEIRTIISLGVAEGAVEQAEGEMIHKVFQFGDREVHEVMTPRPEMVALEQGSHLSDFLSLFAASPHGRFPVYEENIDNIVGLLSSKDVLAAMARGPLDAEAPLEPLVRPAYFVPETKQVAELLAEMRRERLAMVIVIDEYGGTAGLVTMGDLLEEIVGRLRDEVEATREVETIDERTFQIDAGMRIDEANEQLGLALPPGPYETVAGFLLSQLGHIPKEGEQLRYDDLKLVVSEMRGVKIERVLIARG